MRRLGSMARWTSAIGLAALLAMPAAAHAKGGFKGKFGGAPFKAFKVSIVCQYERLAGFFQISGVSKPKIHLSSRTADVKWAQMAGVGADPTAPGAAFPIELGSTEAGFVYAKGVGIGTDASSLPGWVAGGDDGFRITLTGYKKGKVVGTFAGTLPPGIGNANGPIQASGSFASACIVQ